MRTNAIAVSYSKELGIHDEYGRAEKAVRETTPPSHNRIFRERTEAEFKRRILGCCYGEADVHTGDWVYYIHRRNLGTKSYPYIIEAVEYDVVKSIGVKQCTMKYSGDRPRHEDIIAVFIGRDL